MKTFKRTNKGISNQHLFYGVDLVVYLEGGPKAYNKEQVYNDFFHEETDDIIFWGNLFNRFKTATKVKFKSIGSKTTIKEIAVDIIAGKINSVMVAMDNEFDEILAQRIENDNVLYTHGYSWENDVWSHEVIRAVIQELSAINIEPDDIKQNFENFISKIKIGVLADGYLFSKGNSFFPRQKGHLFCVNCEPDDLPEAKKDTLNSLLAKKGLKTSTLYSYGRRKNINIKRHCYGHLLADYCCQVVIHYLKNRLGLPSLNKTIIYRMGLNRFFQNFFDNTTIHDYYQNQFNRNSA